MKISSKRFFVYFLVAMLLFVSLFYILILTAKKIDSLVPPSDKIVTAILTGLLLGIFLGYKYMKIRSKKWVLKLKEENSKLTKDNLELKSEANEALHKLRKAEAQIRALEKSYVELSQYDCQVEYKYTELLSINDKQEELINKLRREKGELNNSFTAACEKIALINEGKENLRLNISKLKAKLEARAKEDAKRSQVHKKTAKNLRKARRMLNESNNLVEPKNWTKVLEDNLRAVENEDKAFVRLEKVA
jgi:chromosome segregation ATPase